MGNIANIVKKVILPPLAVGAIITTGTLAYNLHFYKGLQKESQEAIQLQDTEMKKYISALESANFALQLQQKTINMYRRELEKIKLFNEELKTDKEFYTRLAHAERDSKDLYHELNKNPEIILSPDFRNKLKKNSADFKELKKLGEQKKEYLTTVIKRYDTPKTQNSQGN